MAGADAAAAAAEIDAYRFTVDAIVCIERAFEDLAGAGLRQGPRMRTAGGAVAKGRSTEWQPTQGGSWSTTDLSPAKDRQQSLSGMEEMAKAAALNPLHFRNT